MYWLAAVTSAFIAVKILTNILIIYVFGLAYEKFDIHVRRRVAPKSKFLTAYVAINRCVTPKRNCETELI